MVIVLIHLLLLLPSLLIAAEFKASVRQNEVGLNDGMILDLTLKDASSKSSPSIEPLTKAFHIHSERQSTNTMVINGKVSSSLTWTFILIPQRAGEVEIPPISIETSEGRLVTKPIKILVDHEKINANNESGTKIRIEREVSRLNPYKNEPFFLKILLFSKHTLANVRQEKFTIEDAIVEQVEEPTVEEKLENGMRIAVVGFKYLVTPLKSGPLIIPPFRVLGDVLQKNKPQSLFDEAFAPFSFMQGFADLQPFNLSTGKLEIEIRPPISGQIPWLPASSLEIQENLSSSGIFQEGEVFTRSFVIKAEGIHSSQLPSLERKQDTHGQFKVYADNPQLKNDVAGDKLNSTRIEQYTLIPQKSGELVLPEISIKWWDVKSEKMQETIVPERAIQVLPALGMFPGKVQPANETQDLTSHKFTIHPFMYVVIGGLIVLLGALSILLLFMLRKMNRLTEGGKVIAPKVYVEKKYAPTQTVKITRVKPASAKKGQKLDDLNPT